MRGLSNYALGVSDGDERGGKGVRYTALDKAYTVELGLPA